MSTVLQGQGKSQQPLSQARYQKPASGTTHKTSFGTGQVVKPTNPQTQKTSFAALTEVPPSVTTQVNAGRDIPKDGVASESVKKPRKPPLVMSNPAHFMSSNLQKRQTPISRASQIVTQQQQELFGKNNRQMTGSVNGRAFAGMGNLRNPNVQGMVGNMNAQGFGYAPQRPIPQIQGLQGVPQQGGQTLPMSGQNGAIYSGYPIYLPTGEQLNMRVAPNGGNQMVFNHGPVGVMGANGFQGFMNPNMNTNFGNLGMHKIYPRNPTYPEKIGQYQRQTTANARVGRGGRGKRGVRGRYKRGVGRGRKQNYVSRIQVKEKNDQTKSYHDTRTDIEISLGDFDGIVAGHDAETRDNAEMPWHGSHQYNKAESMAKLDAQISMYEEKEKDLEKYQFGKLMFTKNETKKCLKEKFSKVPFVIQADNDLQMSNLVGNQNASGFRKGNPVDQSSKKNAYFGKWCPTKVHYGMFAVINHMKKCENGKNCSFHLNGKCSYHHDDKFKIACFWGPDCKNFDWCEYDHSQFNQNNTSIKVKKGRKGEQVFNHYF